MKSVILVISALMMFLVPSMAYAELTTITGINDEIYLFVGIHEDNSNLVQIKTKDNTYEYTELEIKTYKSGAFRMSNEYMVLFAHQSSDTHYRLVLITSEQVQRLIGAIVVYDESVPTGVIEPENSIGTDISNYDIPDITRDDGKTDFILLVKTDEPYTQYLDQEYVFNASIQNGRNHDPLVNATVTVEIVRDNFLLKESSMITENGGNVSIDFGYFTYPLFYPNFCYDVIVTTEYENYTNVWLGDFKIGDLGSYWNPDTSWIGQAAYSHYPEEYKTEPRSEIRSDTKCNNEN